MDGFVDVTKKKLQRRRGACAVCKAKKVRCDGERPTCATCAKANTRCTYLMPRKKHSMSVTTNFSDTPDAIQDTSITTSRYQPSDVFQPCASIALTSPITSNLSASLGSPDDLVTFLNCQSNIFTGNGPTADDESLDKFDICFAGQRQQNESQAFQDMLEGLWEFIEEPSSPLSTDWNQANRREGSTHNHTFSTITDSVDLEAFHFPTPSSSNSSLTNNDELSAVTNPAGSDAVFSDPFIVDEYHTSIDNFLEFQTSPNITVDKSMMVSKCRDVPGSPLSTTFKCGQILLNANHQYAQEIQRCCHQMEDEINARFHFQRISGMQSTNMKLDKDLAEKCAILCFNDLEGIGQFLDLSETQRILDSVWSNSDNAPAKVILVLVAVALGAYNLDHETFPAISDRIGFSNVMFRCALKCYDDRFPRKEFIFDFQALLSLLYLANKCGCLVTSDLLSSAIACAQKLQLNSDEGIKRLCLSNTEENRLKRAFWFLYAFEKPYCMRWGIAPRLDEDFINYEATDHFICKAWVPLHKKQDDLLRISCQYARLCSGIIKNLYSQKSLGKPDTSLRNIANQLCRQAEIWKNAAITSCGSGQKNTGGTTPTQDTAASLQRFKIMYRYHEANFAIHGRGANVSSSDPPRIADLQGQYGCRRSEHRLLEAAREVLSTCGDTVPIEAAQYDWSILHTLSTAACILVQLSLVSNSVEKDITFLAMIAGFFARLSFTNQVPFKEVSAMYNICWLHACKGDKKQATSSDGYDC
ncbi:hypothetical protein ONS96_011369 [Cadophora gregata f. sp. sojae]|nr:hypothetical protein ONS96_011369 [Cadophora gregata f. sp. sojae]